MNINYGKEIHDHLMQKARTAATFEQALGFEHGAVYAKNHLDMDAVCVTRCSSCAYFSAEKNLCILSNMLTEEEGYCHRAVAVR